LRGSSRCAAWLAIVQREVFGAEASMAFLVVVLLPLIRAPRIVAAIRRVVLALKRVSSARRGMDLEAQGAPPPAPLRNQSGRSLQCVQAVHGPLW